MWILAERPLKGTCGGPRGLNTFRGLAQLLLLRSGPVIDAGEERFEEGHLVRVAQQKGNTIIRIIRHLRCGSSLRLRNPVSACAASDNFNSE